MTNSDVKRGQNLEAEAKALRPRPGLWGWGRGQNNYEKSTKWL